MCSLTQQARNVHWELEAAGTRPRVLVRDRDAKVAPASDTDFAGQGARVVRTPARAQPASPAAAVVRRGRLSGLIHEYDPASA